MEQIVLQSVIAQGNALRYVFSVSQGLEPYFSGKPFVMEYPMDISGVPEAVLAVPFVCNVLPIIWLTDSRLVLPELDKDFFDCIPNVKKGYEAMFPESVFAGEVCPERIVECRRKENGGCGALFSGGLDATQTLVDHFDEKPHLISIWGSDIRYDNEEGWKAVHDGIAETAKRFSLPDAVIRSSFREFDREGVLHETFSEQLKDGWWHGVKHGLALLGHTAPYAYCAGLATVYIAASNCPADGVVRCASNPSTDNHVRFSGCRVVHDGFAYSRQDKVGNVVGFVRKTGKPVTLHACWRSQSGSNCCRCEKCYRTIAGILAEGEDAGNFGFHKAEETLPDMQRYIVEGKVLNENLAISYWKHIHDRVCQNKPVLEKKAYWKHIKWIGDADFLRHDQLKMPLRYRVQRKLAGFRLYQALSKVKGKLTGR